VEELLYLTIDLRLHGVTSFFPRIFLKTAEPRFEIRRKKVGGFRMIDFGTLKCG
jgi:hypothetical protein